MATKITVLEEAPQNTSENSQLPQNEPGSESEIQRAEAYGRLEAEYRQAQDRIAQLESRIAQLEVERADVGALRAELAQLRVEVMEFDEELEAENSDVTLIEPELEPEPVKTEAPPDQPKESFFGIVLRM